jgi:hypothetical protein
MKDFLSRAYRIVTGTADECDMKKTNIHACLAHVLLVSSNVKPFLTLYVSVLQG